MLASVEIAETLAVDAMEFGGPSVWVCLGTRTATLDTKGFYRGREKVWKAIRRRWPDAEAVTIREFTTGYGPRSGGKRRPHWNLLIKNVPTSAVDELRAVAARVWCQHVDALPARQYAGTVYESGGLMRYLALHFLKESQAPPKGWKGHRVTATRGYYGAGTKEARRRARRSLQLKREAWRIEQSAVDEDGIETVPVDVVDELAAAAVEAMEGRDWKLVREHSGGPAGEWTPKVERRRFREAVGGG